MSTGVIYYQRILKFLPVSRLVVMKEGRIVRQVKQGLLEKIEKGGYASL